MSTLFIGVFMFLTLFFLNQKPEREVSDSRSKASWDDVEKRERDIQRTKEKVAHRGFPTA